MVDIVNTTTTTTKKSHVTKPEKQDGQDLDQFWHLVRLYIIANKKDFKKHEDKIIFALLFIHKKATDIQAHNFINNALKYNPVNWGTREDFEKELKSVFANPNKKKWHKTSWQSFARGT